MFNRSKLLIVGLAVLLVTLIYSKRSQDLDLELLRIEHLRSARHQEEVGNVSAAITQYELVLAIDPEDPDTLNNLATLYYKLEDFDRARALFQRIIDNGGSSALVNYNLGTADLADGNHQQAYEAFSDFLDKETHRTSELAREVARWRVEFTVDRWRKAWERTAESNRIDDYRALYARDFSSSISKMRTARWDFDTWMKDQERKALLKEYIEVEIEDLDIVIGGELATARFCQLYRSNDHQDVGRKELTLRLVGRQWKITQEEWKYESCASRGLSLYREVENTQSPKREIARSVEGRRIYAFEWGSGPVVTMVLGGFHGDEPVGVELVLRFADELSAKVTGLDQATVVCVPVVNPDGLIRGTRVNANLVDLNRNFPTGNWSPESSRARYFPGRTPGSEPEVRALTLLIKQYEPDKIISVHAPLHMVNYDGPGRNLAEEMAKHNSYPVRSDIGYETPGSFGQYAGVERGIPVITLELPDVSVKRAWQDNATALQAAIDYRATSNLWQPPLARRHSVSLR